MIGRIQVKFTSEIAHAVDRTLVLALTFIVPFDAKPNVFTGFRVVKKFPRISDTSKLVA